MKVKFIVLLLLLGNFSVEAQERNLISRTWHNIFNDTVAARPKLLAYPTVAFSPETSWELGISSLYVFYALQDTLNRLSEINGFTFITLENQWGLWFDHVVYSNRDKWIFLGRLRYQSFPLLYYGIGPSAPSHPQAEVENILLLIRERVMRKIIPNLYVGLEAEYQRLSSVVFVPTQPAEVELPVGSGGSGNLGLGLGIIYDRRHNVLNVRDGLFSELAFMRYHNAWGSDYEWSTVTSDSRYYKKINRRDVLAMQLLGQFNVGEVPFNQLSMMGGESINRGYYMGRYRDKNQLAAQAEYRMLPFPFSKRLGGAVFAGSGTVYGEADRFTFNNVVFSGGGGLRLLLFPKKDIFTRFDVAFTREGHGFYFFIGEAF